MKINKGTIEHYLEDTHIEIENANETEKLKMVRDMALGVTHFCYRSKVAKEIDRDKYLDTLEKAYSQKWLELEKRIYSSNDRRTEP